MAGLCFQVELDWDQTLTFRLEGLKLLADHLSEPVVIFGPNLKLIYSNSAARTAVSACGLLAPTSTQALDFPLLSQEPCAVCPAQHVWEGCVSTHQTGQENADGDDQASSCPFITSFPIQDQAGGSTCVVMMGRSPIEGTVWRSDLDPNVVPGGKTGQADYRSLIGESAVMQQLVEMIGLVAKSDASVLIEGESGTGKELVAKTIHALSRRRSKPFVVVECSSLPETLLESELFGHVRGAFTGAVADRKGLFEEAEGGTIFLDEIADTTSAFQARLLRVLQEGEIKPVGSSQSIKIDVRVISAGHTSFQNLVRSKTFRADLYYRLSVLPLTVPTLRERREDISLLANHFLAQAKERHGRSPLTLTLEALQALSQYGWPGNVRELENLIERVVVTCKNNIIWPQDLFTDNPVHHSTSDLHTIGKTARQEAERENILQVLRVVKGDKTRAARLLGISRSGLYKKIRDYHIA